MTVGLPGAGIGGLFYLLSALAMPFHAATESILVALGVRRRENRRVVSWSLVWRQFATALAIIGGLWVTGWAIAAFLVAHPTALGHVQTTNIGKRLPNVLKIAAVVVSLVTLGSVLLTVQIARIVVAAQHTKPPLDSSVAPRIAATILLLVLVPAAHAQSTSRDSEVARHVALADRAFAEDDTASARREYEAALAIDPEASRPLYRLGALSRRSPREAERFFRQYVRLEPGDAWGWIALGDVLADEKRYRDAIAAYDRAFGIAPAERDVIVGRARILAASGRTDASIAQYELWTSAHSDDAEAQLELAVQQRRAGRYREAERTFSASHGVDGNPRAARGRDYSRAFAAPAVEIVTGGARDSEENQLLRAGAVVSAQVGDRVRAQLGGGRRWLSGFSDVTIDEASAGISARPLAAFRLEVNGGVSRPHSTITVTDTITTPGTEPGRGNGRGRGNGSPPVGTIIQTSSESTASIFVGSVRGVLRQPGGRSSLDLRATRTLLDATPVLAINQVVRNEAAGRADVEVIPRVKLRGGARAATYNSLGDDNSRLALLGGVAVAATSEIELSGVFQRLSFSHATTSGYFAPRLAQLAEAGTYAEFESAGGTVLAIDGGAGVQRLQEFGASPGSWSASYRLFASLDVPMRPGSALHLELDSYDSRLGSDAPSASGSWRFISLSGAVRLALH